jgi:hypothetical protein
MSEFRETLSSLSNQVIARRSLGISALALFLVVPQMWLTWRQVEISEGQDVVLDRQDVMLHEQLDIAKRQLTLAEKQEETNEFLLSKRANLKLLVNGQDHEVALAGAEAELNIAIENAGTKSVKGAYCHLLVPAELAPKATGPIDRYHEDEIGDAMYTVFRCRIAEAIAPQARHPVGAVQIRNAAKAKSYKLIWEFATEAGVNKGELHLQPLAGRK